MRCSKKHEVRRRKHCKRGSRSQAAAVQLLAEAMTIILKPTTVLRKTSSQPSEDLPRVGKAWLKYCFVMRLVAAYVEGDVQKAFELGAEVHRRVWHTTEIYTPANVVQGQAALFHGLVLAGRKAPSSPREASHRRHLLRLYLRELTWWNQASRENFRGDYLLLLGEVARAGGRYNRARRYPRNGGRSFLVKRDSLASRPSRGSCARDVFTHWSASKM